MSAVSASMSGQAPQGRKVAVRPRRVLGTACLVALGALLAAQVARTARAAEPPCAVGDAEYVQLTLQSLDAGAQHFEAFRVTPSGRAEWARWNNQAQLLGLAPPKVPERNVYAALKALASGGTAAPAGEGVASTVSVAAVSAAGRIFSSHRSLPPALEPEIAYLRRMLAPGSPPAGPYLWLLPQAGGGATDLDLGKQPCPRGSLAATVSAALSSGLLVSPIDPAIAQAWAAKHSSRWAFGVRSPGGYTLFGVASAN